MVKLIKEMENGFNLSVVFYNTKSILGHKLKKERSIDEYISCWKLTNTGSNVLLLFSNADPGSKSFWEKNVQLVSTDAKLDISKVKPSEVKALEGITYELGADESLESWQLMYYGAITNIMGQLTEKGFLNTLFGDLELNEESELTVDLSEFTPQTGSSDCYVFANKYLPKDEQYPNSKNYLFNYVTEQPTSQELSLKNGDTEFDVDVLAKRKKATYPNLIDIYEIITFEKKRLKEGIEEINSRLSKGMPTMVGVSYGAKEKPYNSPGYTTDHYVVIVAKGYDHGGYYFRYFDPATWKGSQEDCKLYIKKNKNLMIMGPAKYPVIEGHNYYLVEVRLKNKLLESCIKTPTVSQSIKERI